MFGSFPRGCLSLCFLQASSAAAEQRVSDEGTPGAFPGVSDSGRHSFGYFSFAVERKVTRQKAETMVFRSGKQTSKQDKEKNLDSG